MEDDWGGVGWNVRARLVRGWEGLRGRISFPSFLSSSVLMGNGDGISSQNREIRPKPPPMSPFRMSMSPKRTIGFVNEVA